MIGEFETCPDFRFQNRKNNQWEVIDERRVIYSGEEEEIKSAFQQIIEKEKDIQWKGDLKLVEVHCICKK
jgi:hypothetical protein